MPSVQIYAGFNHCFFSITSLVHMVIGRPFFFSPILLGMLFIVAVYMFWRNKAPFWEA